MKKGGRKAQMKKVRLESSNNHSMLYTKESRCNSRTLNEKNSRRSEYILTIILVSSKDNFEILLICRTAS